jgi:uncharacterized membrane protein
MSKKQSFPFGKVGLNFIFINLSLLHVRNTDHNNFSLFYCFGHFHYFKPVTLGDSDGFTSLVQTDDYLTATLF